jgi:bifunctional non-homologous end joining protein LigD
MMVEDHPVSYFDFEGIIPEGNYGAGTVMVWDMGTWEPLGDAHAMLEKGDLKFRLYGKKLNGEFAIIHMKARRPGSKGNEWLLIKKKDDAAEPGFDIDEFDQSVTTKRSMKEIAGDAGSREWQSNRAAAKTPAKGKNAWLAESIAKAEKTKRASATKSANTAVAAKKTSGRSPRTKSTKTKSAAKATGKKSSDRPAAGFSDLASVKGAVKAAMPGAIHPMLATLTDHAFSGDEWLYEIKWDGYRAIAFIEDAEVRLVSRNQNEMTSLYPELAVLPSQVNAQRAVLDGEIVALDEKGRSSFSLMQQRAGIRSGVKRTRPDDSIPVLYYAFDLLYLDGYNLMRVELEQRKELLRQLITPSGFLRYSEHFLTEGEKLYGAAQKQGLEGIVAKCRTSHYQQKRTRDWLKIKITRRQECVIGGYTDPRGSREHFGSLVLGLYDEKRRLIHIGNAGTGFNAASQTDMWRRLQKLETAKSPFHGRVESTRQPHWVTPELVAEIKFTEWTHEGQSGSVKMRAPVFEGLRFDKPARECRFEKVVPAEEVA